MSAVFSKPQPSSSSHAPGSVPQHHRLRRRIVGISITVLAILLVVLFLLPVWASTERGRAFTLEQINKKFSGTINCSRWRLGWFRGIKIENLTVDNSHGKRIFECREFRTDLTLWGYMWGSYALGNTRVVNPVLNINKYPDGSTDFEDMFAAAEPDHPDRLQTWFSSISGGIKIEHGDIMLRVSGTSEPLHLQNLSAEIPIGSPEVHVHVFLHAGDQSHAPLIAAAGNLPPLNTWLTNPIALTQDLELHASNVPVAALARWLELDPRWAAAFGTSISTLSLSSHSDGTVSTADLFLYANTGSIESHVQVEPHAGYLVLALPDAEYYARLNGRMSRPVAALLKYLNPLFAQAVPGAGTVTISLANAHLDLRTPQAAAATAQLFCAKLQLQPAGLLGDILQLAPHAAGSSKAPLHVAVPPLRFQIADHHLTCDDLTITLPPSRTMHFSGSTGLDGSLHLRLNLKLDTFANQPFALDAGTITVPISGTVDAPKLDLPE